MNSDFQNASSEAQASLEKLTAGNRRYVDEQSGASEIGVERRSEIASGQSPFAVVLGCADSRVCPEHLFDAGLGEIFVVRVAGGVASESVIASVEFAVATFATPLVVVLSHSRCAAVAAALTKVKGEQKAPLTPALDGLVAHVSGVAEQVVSEAGDTLGSEELLSATVRRNAAASATNLAANSELLSAKMSEGALSIVSAHYSLDTGEVGFDVSYSK